MMFIKSFDILKLLCYIFKQLFASLLMYFYLIELIIIIIHHIVLLTRTFETAGIILVSYIIM